MARRFLRIEAAVVGVSLACWLLALVHHLGLVSLAGVRPMSLYSLYGAAGATGWISGNLYQIRRARVAKAVHGTLLRIWWLGPLGIPVLLRTMATGEAQAQAPLVPLLAIAVASIFFAVPMVFRPRG